MDDYMYNDFWAQARLYENRGFELFPTHKEEAKNLLETSLILYSFVLDGAEKHVPNISERMCMILLKLEHHDEAQQIARSLLELNPNSFHARFVLFETTLAEHGLSLDAESQNDAKTTVTNHAELKGQLQSLAHDAVQAYVNTINRCEPDEIRNSSQEFSEMSRAVLQIAENLRRIGVDEKLVYEAVLSISWDNVEFGEMASWFLEFTLLIRKLSTA